MVAKRENYTNKSYKFKQRRNEEYLQSRLLLELLCSIILLQSNNR